MNIQRRKIGSLYGAMLKAGTKKMVIYQLHFHLAVSIKKVELGIRTGLPGVSIM